MTEALAQRLKQSRFSSPQQEALLSILVTASVLNERMEGLCESHGITLPQYNVLRILRGAHPAGHPRCEIASRMIDRAPDVTRLVDRLQARRLVKRTRGGEDQRQALASITAKGLRLLTNMQPKVDALFQTLFQKLSDNDCRELSRLCSLIFAMDPANGCIGHDYIEETREPR